MNYAKQIVKELNQSIEELPIETQIKIMRERKSELEDCNERDKKKIGKRCDEITALIDRIFTLETELYKAKQSGEQAK